MQTALCIAIEKEVLSAFFDSLLDERQFKDEILFVHRKVAGNHKNSTGILDPQNKGTWSNEMDKVILICRHGATLRFVSELHEQVEAVRLIWHSVGCFFFNT